MAYEYCCYTCGMPATQPECESCSAATLREQITPDPREPYKTEELEF